MSSTCPAAADRAGRVMRDEQYPVAEAAPGGEIREVLRTRPVVFDTPRTLTEPLRLGQYDVPAGRLAAPAIPLVHHSDSVQGPQRFDPGRFMDRSGDRSPISSWIPFGGGSRRCVGSRLALLEVETVIPVLLGRRRLTLPETRPEEQRIQHVTLAPARGAQVIVGMR